MKSTERIPRKDQRAVLRQLSDITRDHFVHQYNLRKYAHCVRFHLSEIICKHLSLVSGEKGIIKFCYVLYTYWILILWMYCIEKNLVLIEFRFECFLFHFWVFYSKSVLLLFQSHQSFSFIFQPITAFVGTNERIRIRRYFSYMFKCFMFMVNNISTCLTSFIIVSSYHSVPPPGRPFPKISHPPRENNFQPPSPHLVSRHIKNSPSNYLFLDSEW